MLDRNVLWHLEDITAQPERRLIKTLEGFLPKEWCRLPTKKSPFLPFGHHLIWFNTAAPSHALLHDGTDDYHSPPDPWVRRMWAGGSVQLKPDQYFDRKLGFTMDTAIAGAERIKDVRLHGQGDTAKIFVTIERRFARLDQLLKSHKKVYERAENAPNVRTHFRQQLRDDEEWGDAILKEERNLVFFKERTTAEMDAIKAGQMAPVRYLDSPGKPDFSHTLTPTRALLFRFSALTFNAHLIHLDRDYARNIEGHRNLLVHGPLSLMLILQAVSGYVANRTEYRQVVESIEYRNLAPLYCDEQMTICGVEKKKSNDGSTYEVWIEGPTGGVAVKGTVRTVSEPAKPASSAPSVVHIGNNNDKPRRASKRTIEDGSNETVQANDTVPDVAPLVSSTSSVRQPSGNTLISNELPKHELLHQDTQPDSATFTPPSNPDVDTSGHSAPANVSSPVGVEKQEGKSGQLSSQVYGRMRPTRTKYYQFITAPSPAPVVRRVSAPPKPMKPTMSPRTQNIMGRVFRREPPKASIKPKPLLRRYGARPYEYDASRHSRFGREGVRKIEKLRITFEGQALGSLRRKVRRRSPR
ncbi:hypothetical protein N0V83_007465 [Neocucurbitaria cava]|uniref:Uncharacterized protein n=1 Tax=Neocucurbitaria cava TaxID=798079 RepID=A0A9W9CJG2_9PLEO|nr:hypothetical protein N0V83_007465 [Neocucurbitaria cava]